MLRWAMWSAMASDFRAGLAQWLNVQGLPRAREAAMPKEPTVTRIAGLSSTVACSSAHKADTLASPSGTPSV